MDERSRRDDDGPRRDDDRQRRDDDRPPRRDDRPRREDDRKPDGEMNWRSRNAPPSERKMFSRDSEDRPMSRDDRDGGNREKSDRFQRFDADPRDKGKSSVFTRGGDRKPDSVSRDYCVLGNERIFYITTFFLLLFAGFVELA